MTQANKNNNSTDNSQGLGVMALAAIVVSSMIGGGIYSLPQNMAAGASVGAVILSWIITGFGVFFIANTFRTLSIAKPNLTSGIYMYSREGFGPYVGFTIGWSYWLCQICGNVGYAVITMDALNYFFPPHFAGGNNLPSIIGGSILIWGFNFLVLRGMKQASFINTIGTIAKITPLILFIIITMFVFHLDHFDFNFWGENTKNLGGLSTQIKSTMLVTLWSFIGIEGAVVLSKHAKNPNSVGRATCLGFLGCLIIYILLSVLPYGYMSQEELAAIPNPSTGGILEKIVGPWGAWLMNIGLVISVLTSWLAWTMITAQVPQAAAENGTFPKQFALENKHGAPSVSLWITSLLMQLFIFMVYFSNNAWNVEHHRRNGFASVFLKLCIFMENLRRWRISRKYQYQTLGCFNIRHNRINLCFMVDLRRRAKIFVDGCNFHDLGHSCLCLGSPSIRPSTTHFFNWRGCSGFAFNGYITMGNICLFTPLNQYQLKQQARGGNLTFLSPR